MIKNNRFLWLAASGLVIISLLMAACGQAATPTTPAAPTTPATPTAPTAPVTPTTPTAEKPQQEAVKPAAEKPKYGGTLILSATSDPVNWDPVRVITGIQYTLTHQKLWQGDWARGIAGGFGTNETDWGFANNDLFNLYKSSIAESWKWTLDAANNQGTIVLQVGQGIRWQSPNTEAGRLVNGRELTADDVFYNLKRATTIGTVGFVWTRAVDVRNADISKTGPREITIKMSAPALMNGIARLMGQTFMVPPETVAKYGDLQNWKTYVGTGSFMLTEFVPGSLIRLTRNPTYWEKDPVGPGKGNQLPYLDGVKVLIIPDASTLQAALRTGKIDWIGNLTKDDAAGIKKTANGIVEKWSTSYQGRGTPIMMRTDKAPFNDIRVRKAMMLATDFQAILKGLYGGEGQINTVPYSRIKGYEELHLSIEDPDVPPEVKELYIYNPEKAKQLLKEAGYPNGFKTTLLLTSTNTAEIDYYSIVKDMWAKVGIQVTFDLKENAAASAIRSSRTHEALVTSGTGPIATFYMGSQWIGQSTENLNMIDDPYLKDTIDRVRVAGLTDLHEAMRIYREGAKHALAQAYGIPNVIGTFHNLWWPWLKNYSGEMTIGFDNLIWPQYIWYDQELKKKMGY